MPSRIDIGDGTRVGRIVVLRRAPNIGSGTAYHVRCDCGTEKVVRGAGIRQRTTQSCGCLRAAMRKQRAREAQKQAVVRDEFYGYRSIIATYARGAKMRGHAWELSPRDALQLFVSECFYCGRPPSNRWGNPRRRPFTGIDRIDNRRGYTADNVVPCCTLCNRAKSSMRQEEFEAWLNQVAFMRSGEALKLRPPEERITYADIC
jgi:hypothetical protein